MKLYIHLELMAMLLGLMFFEHGTYTVKVGEPGTNNERVLKGLESSVNNNNNIEIKF